MRVLLSALRAQNQHEIVADQLECVFGKFKLVLDGLKAQDNLLLDLHLDHMLELLGRLRRFVFLCKLLDEGVH